MTQTSVEGKDIRFAHTQSRTVESQEPEMIAIPFSDREMEVILLSCPLKQPVKYDVINNVL